MKRFLYMFVATLFFIYVADSYTNIYSLVAQFHLSSLDSETKGEIVVSEGANQNTMRSIGPYIYMVEYLYYVEDASNMYRNNIVKYDISDIDVERILEAYPVGREVTVYYDSKSPYWSILEKGTILPRKIYIKCITVLILGLLFGLLFSWIFKSGWR